jgi:hypothetical protein
VSQRESGYERIERDLYETPEWVTTAVVPHLGLATRLWEPAAGGGKMAKALTAADFLAQRHAPLEITYPHGIVTNPPYALAAEFIEHALDLMRPSGMVAMLLRTDFDHAKGRAHLFAGCKAFAKKLVLTKRIVWFDRPGAAPSFNHAWYIWSHSHSGPPVLAYDLQL